MDIAKFKARLSDDVIAPIIEFMEELGEGCEYSKKDVQKCEEILAQYLESLAALPTPTDKDNMKCVKKAVLALNKLNEKTDYALIETVERENIWELIQTSAVECGLQDPADDITEEWREW